MNLEEDASGQKSSTGTSLRDSKDALLVSVKSGREMSSEVLLAWMVVRPGERLVSRDARVRVDAREGEGGLESEIVGGAISPAFRGGEARPSMFFNIADGRPLPMFGPDLIGFSNFEPVDCERVEDAVGLKRLVGFERNVRRFGAGVDVDREEPPADGGDGGL